MLSRLHVKNVALISQADIEFGGGLNVLSGETGSGKSVILDSINFVLGCKADRTMIRYGENEALVRAEFTVDVNSKAVKKLEEYDIESDGIITITRKLNLDGKGAIKVNGNSVTATMLKSITQHLVDVHGQSEHFFLLSEDNQLKVIDSLLGNNSESIKNELSKLILQKRQYKTLINSLGGDEAERARKLDLLDYQIKEIENAGLHVGEFDELKARQSLILNIEKILTSINSAVAVLNNDGGCSDGLNVALREMMRISGLNEDYSQVCTRLENVNTEITDISETLSDMADNLSFDADDAQAVEERLSIIKNLQKKYGVDEEHILAFKDKAKAEYEAISEAADTINKYNNEIVLLDDKIFELCVKLTDLRKRASVKFCSSVVNELKTLNIPDAKFNVHFNEYDRSSVNLQSTNGSDEVCFEFSANKGEPLKPLNKVISGGEMSRFMLAIKTRLKDLNGISTYIFDEIDAGISGHTAGLVAEKFKDISKNTQIIAVSHLPQVCAASDNQYLIYKIEENDKTLTKIRRLSDNEKINEIVRLTGSVMSETAKLHAEELICRFKN